MATDEQFNLLLWVLEVQLAIEAMGIKQPVLSPDFVRRTYFGGMTAWKAARTWSEMPGQAQAQEVEGDQVR